MGTKKAEAEEAEDRRRTLYPVDGTVLYGFPMKPLLADPEVAERLERTGAFEFRTRRDGDADAEPMTVDNPFVAELDRYDSPVEHGEHYKSGSQPAAQPVEETDDTSTAPDSAEKE